MPTLPRFLSISKSIRCVSLSQSRLLRKAELHRPAMASSHVIRVTMFKIPKKEDRDEMVKYYEVLSKAQSKDGAPYILSLEAGPTEEDARSQGFTFLAKTVFKNREDFEFYDKVCEAHKEMKAKAKGLDIQGMMMLYYTPAVAAGPNL